MIPDHFYQLMIHHAPDAIFILNLDGSIYECSDKAASLLGYSKEVLLTLRPHDWDDMIPHADIDALLKQVNATPVYFETRHKRQDGTAYPAGVTAVRISVDGRAYLYCSVRDLTIEKHSELRLRDVLVQQNKELKQKQKDLQLQEDEIKMVFELSQDGLAVLDLNTKFVRCNRAYLEMTGYSEEELLQQACVDLTVEEDHARTKEAMEYALKTGSIKNFEKSCYRKDRSIIIVSMGITLTPNKQFFIVSAKDITHIKKNERQLRNIAHYDQLTKLPNRYLLHDRLMQSIRLVHKTQKIMAIAYLDLDGFKQVNDHYGHDVGDQLLVTVSKRMSEALRLDDTLARLGGDEFVVILNGLDEVGSADLVLNRLLKASAMQMTIQQHLINSVSASIGVTFYEPQAGDIDGDTLLRQADQAMYRAKALGKNQIVFYRDLSSTPEDHTQNKHSISQALINQEFVLHYQPKVNLQTGRFVGVEALVRWNAKVTEGTSSQLMYPERFIPLIDNHPLMYELDRWVIREALAQLARWQAQGKTIAMTINLSAYSFTKGRLVSDIERILALYPDLLMSQLELDILASSALENLADIQQQIIRLKEKGIKIAIDSFGTDFSSLVSFKRLGVDVFKIDKMLVKEMLDNENNVNVVDTSIRLASAFDAQSLAKGIESIEHGCSLIHHGCQLAQGYVISPPLTADKVVDWIESWQPPKQWKDCSSD